MIPDEITNALSSSSPDAVACLLDDPSVCFLVDWREDDADIVSYCEDILRTGELSGEWLGEKLTITYRGQKTQVPLTESPGDRHITLVTLNEILAPEHEIRVVNASLGSDTLGFVALRSEDWAQVQKEFPTSSHVFRRIKSKPNLFHSEKRWWEFWK